MNRSPFFAKFFRRHLLFLAIFGFYSNSLFGIPTGSWTAYVVNKGSNTVTPINTASNIPGRLILFPEGTQLGYIAITPDGSKAYVTESTLNIVTPINIATNTLGIPFVLASIAEGIAITPDGTKMFVTNPRSNSVTPIDLTTNSPVPGIPIVGFSTPTGIAITPDGTTAYVVNQGRNNVIPIDIATNTLGLPIPVGMAPFGIAITPDGTKAYVANSASNTVTPIDLITSSPGIPISVGALKPQEIAITPDGTIAYVTNSDSGNVTPIDIAINMAGPPIFLGNGPDGIAITPDGKTAYVDIFDIDILTCTPGSPILVGNGPLSIAITPDQAPTASFTFMIGEVGSPTTFDASSSFSPVGVIASYAWDFGDGQTLTTTYPTTSHVYNESKSYYVTLTVTNSTGTSTAQVFTGQTASRNGAPSATITHSVNVINPSLFLSPPSHFIGAVFKNLGITIHHLTWKPSVDPSIAAYILRNNGHMIAIIPATGPFALNVKKRKNYKKDHYTLVAVNANGVESQPVAVTLP